MTDVSFVKVDGNVYEVPVLKHVTFTISQPMSGIQLNDVKLARQHVIEHFTGKGWTYVDNVITSFENDPDPKPLWYLGKSLELMSKCDVVIFMEGWEKARGCQLEHAACEAYGIHIIEDGALKLK